MSERSIDAPAGSTAQLRAALTSTPIDEAAVKDAVFALVDDMKKLGAPPERVIIEIKRISEIENTPLYRAFMRKESEEARAGRALVDDAVRWCIGRYYGS
jgi:hypothetical protein